VTFKASDILSTTSMDGLRVPRSTSLIYDRLESASCASSSWLRLRFLQAFLTRFPNFRQISIEDMVDICRVSVLHTISVI